MRRGGDTFVVLTEILSRSRIRAPQALPQDSLLHFMRHPLPRCSCPIRRWTKEPSPPSPNAIQQGWQEDLVRSILPALPSKNILISLLLFFYLSTALLP